MKPVWYAGPDTFWGDAWTMLHLPYTLMVLSFVTVGAALAPHRSAEILGATLLAYFLGLGVGAHFLDQIPGMGSHYVRNWPTWGLWAVGLSSVVAAVGIGVFGAILVLGPSFLVLVAVQGLVALGYPLAPVFRGTLHRESVFAVSWGSLPFLTSYLAQSGPITWELLLVMVAFAGVAVLEIRLSRISRDRRSAARIGTDARSGDPATSVWSASLPDRALQALVAGVGLLALGLYLSRWVAGR